MQKTVRELLNTLPKRVAAKAIKNQPELKRLDETFDDTASEALLGAFTWGSSKEGHDYWQRQYESLLSKERKQQNN